MNLTPEQQKVGKENFNEAVAVTRRDFLSGTVAAGLATGAGLGSIYFGYGASVGDPLRVGFIGTGDEASVLMVHIILIIFKLSRLQTFGMEYFVLFTVMYPVQMLSVCDLVSCRSMVGELRTKP